MRANHVGVRPPKEAFLDAGRKARKGLGASTILGVALALTVTTITRAAIMQGPIENADNGHRYYLLTQNSWTASQAEATSLGGNLATVRNQAENDWIFNQFFRSQGNGWAGWIGLSRSTVGGSFSWSSGEALSYTNWATGEPNFPDEQFVYQLPTLNGNLVSGKWNNDYDRTTATYSPLSGPSIPLFQIHGVVEIVPEPSSAALMLASCAAGLRRRRYGG